MIEPRTRPRPVARLVRRKLFWGAVSVPLAIAGLCGWLTADLEPPSSAAPSTPKIQPPPPRDPKSLPDWPSASATGRDAVALLLGSLAEAKARLEASGGYTAVFRKVERVKGRLGAEQVLEMKCRNDPFAIYLKFRTPEPGKEVVFCTGRYEDHVIAHGTGISRALIPRLKVPPDSALAMAGNRHPITDAGLLNLTKKLLGFREMDLLDPEAGTVLDRYTDDDGRAWLRSVHTHPHRKPDRPFERVEVLYDPETRIPHRIKNFDWREEGETGDPKLAESYRYDDVKLGAELSDLDFDPANPSYEFSRF